MGAVIQNAAVPLDGYMTGFTINAVVMVASGLLGLLLLWPNTERKRLMAQVAGAAEVRVSNSIVVPANAGTTSSC